MDEEALEVEPIQKKVKIGKATLYSAIAAVMWIVTVIILIRRHYR